MMIARGCLCVSSGSCRRGCWCVSRGGSCRRYERLTGAKSNTRRDQQCAHTRQRRRAHGRRERLPAPPLPSAGSGSIVNVHCSHQIKMNERHENLRRKSLVCLRPLPVVRRPDFYHRWNFPPCFHSRVEIEHVQRWLPERQTALCGVLPTAISTGAFHWWRDWCDERRGDRPRAGQKSAWKCNLQW